MARPYNLATVGRLLGLLMAVGGTVALGRLLLDDRPTAWPAVQVTIDVIGIASGLALALYLRRHPPRERLLVVVVLLTTVLIAGGIACFDTPYGAGILFTWLAPCAFLLGNRVAIADGTAIAAGLGGALLLQATRVDEPYAAGTYVGTWAIALSSYVVVGIITRRLMGDVDAAEQRFGAAFRDAPIGMAIISPQAGLLRVNAAACALWGADEETLRGLPGDRLMHPDDAEAVRAAFARVLAGEPRVELEARFRRADGSFFHAAIVQTLVDSGGETFVLSQTRDITVERELDARREEMERSLRHRSLHDPLTGLPNRSLLLDRLRHALARGRRDGAWLAVLFLDLDDFKNVNDSLGHEAGDELLRELAPRLQAQLRAADSLGRFGGDEFVALCESLSGPQEAVAVAERLQLACGQPVSLGGAEFFPSASIGIAVAEPGSDVEPEALLRDADLAMYRAKGSGKRRAELFDGAMRAEALDRVQLTNDLRRAVERGELELHFQPVVSLQRQAVQGFEALVRWNHPRRGLLGADAFVPLAEENGRIVEIGRWVVDETARHAALWPDLILAFNVSRRQLVQPGFADDVAAACARWDVDPVRIVAEVTESALGGDVQTVRRNLEQLERTGVDVALDDFGTGHSSLSSVGDFPLKALKLDRSFLPPPDAPDDRWTLVQAMAEMGTRIGLRVVAEGIEAEAQARRLTAMGCEYGQGYLFSRPVPAGDVPDLVRRLEAQLAATRP